MADYEKLKSVIEKKIEEYHKELISLNDDIADHPEISGEEYNKVLERYCRLVEEFSVAGGYDIETNINM